jgi:excisionase family DNA binding protein
LKGRNMNEHPGFRSELKLLTVGQVAEICHCTPATIHNRIRAGHLRTVRIGERVQRISEAELRRYLTLDADGLPLPRPQPPTRRAAPGRGAAKGARQKAREAARPE